LLISCGFYLLSLIDVLNESIGKSKIYGGVDAAFRKQM